MAMSLMIVEGIAAAYLAFQATMFTTRRSRAALLYQFIPLVIAAVLGFRAFGAFMGWPV